MEQKRTTSKMIARELGIARSTVSMALRDHPDIAQATRQQVHAAARRRGYVPNAMARSMVTGQTRVVGFLCNQPPSAEYVARMLTGAMAEAEQCGHLVKILQASDDVRCREVVNLCMEYCLCGILDVSGTIQSSVRAEELRRAGIPLVLLDSTLPDQQSVRVVSDDPQGVSAAIRHLMDLGHRRIAHLAGHPIAGSAVSRREAYLSTMADAGLDVPEGYVDCHSYEPADANPAVARLLGRPDAPTALFCASDNLAMAAIRAARRLGADVPRTLSVVGFAGLFMGELADPPLTTVAQPFEQMGREGMRALLDGRTPPADIVLPAKLVIRDSTCGLALHPKRSRPKH